MIQIGSIVRCTTSKEKDAKLLTVKSFVSLEPEVEIAFCRYDCGSSDVPFLLRDLVEVFPIKVIRR